MISQERARINLAQPLSEEPLLSSAISRVNHQDRCSEATPHSTHALAWSVVWACDGLCGSSGQGPRAQRQSNRSSTCRCLPGASTVAAKDS